MLQNGWLLVLNVGLAVGQIIESRRGAVDKAHWKMRNVREFLSQLGVLLILIPLIYFCIYVHWLVMLQI